jgi:hypothetical protein
LQRRLGGGCGPVPACQWVGGEGGLRQRWGMFPIRDHDPSGRRACVTRAGPILPLIGGTPDAGHARLERHVCIDTTASGGNAQLLVEAAEA